MNRSLYHSRITGGIIKKIDLEIKREGFSQAMRNLIKNTGGRLELKNKSGGVKKSLKKGPTLIIANHPSQAEVLVMLAALPERKDVFLIASHCFLNILPSIDRHIIPVYIGHRENERGLNLKYRIFKCLQHSPWINKEEAHQKNVKSIADASKKIDDGGLVIIFPAAAEDNGKFLPGVGHLVKNIKNKDGANLVMVHITGTSTWDYLRIIPLLGRLMPKFVVNFSQPAALGNFYRDDPKEIANKLEKRYYDWSAKL